MEQRKRHSRKHYFYFLLQYSRTKKISELNLVRSKTWAVTHYSICIQWYYSNEGHVLCSTSRLPTYRYLLLSVTSHGRHPSNHISPWVVTQAEHYNEGRNRTGTNSNNTSSRCAKWTVLIQRNIVFLPLTASVFEWFVATVIRNMACMRASSAVAEIHRYFARAVQNTTSNVFTPHINVSSLKQSAASVMTLPPLSIQIHKFRFVADISQTKRNVVP